jgi:hypothetical protein
MAQVALSRDRGHGRAAGGLLLLPVVIFAGGLMLAACFVAYVLWPSWPGRPIALDAPSLPITIAGTLFEVPPAAIRVAIERHPGSQERLDLAFSWPSLRPLQPDAGPEARPDASSDAEPPALAGGSGSSPTNAAAAAVDASDRLFVTIAPLGQMLPAAERLRSIYPRYVASHAAAGAQGLAIVPFRADTPYEGEDLVYLGDNPSQFYARCTRPSGVMPGTCMQERSIGAADVTLRFPRDWLNDWQSVSAGFDRLMAQLHPQAN